LPISLYRVRRLRCAQSDVEIERHRRIVVAAWAYAYEVESKPIVDDASYDCEAALICPEVSTGHVILDEFFRTEFAPHTGAWVNKHPEKHKLPRICAIQRQV
jgi:hypothetical protein